MFRVATTEEVKRSLLDAIRSSGAGWHDRTTIAKKLGKKYLNPAEVLLLDLMAQAGEIEKAMQPTKQPHIMRTVYRIKEADEK